MCGFGPRTGATSLAELGDPHRFANPGRLAAYAGLAPVDRQSGRSHRTGRSRGGNHRLHNAMFIAVFVATQHDPDARAYYLRKRAQGKAHNAAVICVARRTLQHHPGHAQDPDALPTPPPPQTTRRGLTTTQGPPRGGTRRMAPPPVRTPTSPRPESCVGRHGSGGGRDRQCAETLSRNGAVSQRTVDLGYGR